MPTFTKESSQGWIHRWNDFQDYEVVSDTDTRIKLEYSEEQSGDDFDSERSPYDILLKVVDGAIKRVTWRNEDGDTEATLTGLNFGVDLFRLFIDQDDGNPWRLYDMMVAEGTRFEMANQARDDSGMDVTTSVGDDVVRAIGGDSYIKDRGGADRYIGDDNYDTVAYNEWYWRQPERVESGIVADLRDEYVIGPDGERDLVRNIDSVRGTFKKDVMRGDSDYNEFMGYRGADIINGRGGSDRVSYRNDEDQGGRRGVDVNLGEGYAFDGFGKRDTLKNIEQAEGTDYDDVFRDDRGDNYFRGRDGDDTFHITKGNDEVEGEDGADTFIFKGNNFGFNSIEDFNPEDGDRIKINSADSLSDVSIETNEDGERFITFNNSEIFLNNYEGSVSEYLIF